MTSLKITAVIAISMLAATSVVIAKRHTPEERGKTLFNDPKLGGGTSGNSCGTCHPDGRGLEGIGSKKGWKNPAGAFKTLEDAVNVCIEMALKGKALDVKSEQMTDILSYLRSLKPKTGEPPQRPR